MNLFTGSVPQGYEDGLGPVLFEPFAVEMAGRIKPGAHVLELASGTGRLTRHLIPVAGSLVASDYSHEMLEIARKKLPDSDFHLVDAKEIPFPDHVFDTVVCQFGVMFFPDKVTAFREVKRVLRKGGNFLFSVWGELAGNPWADTSREVLRDLFEGGLHPESQENPFDYCDAAVIEKDLAAAGFGTVRFEVVRLPMEVASVESFVTGLAKGSPLAATLEKKGMSDPTPFMTEVASRYRARFGHQPMRTTMEAIVVSAMSP